LISAAGIIFFAGNAVHIVKFLRMPTPLRWELYPIPKAPRDRQRHGGSYFEQSNWWIRFARCWYRVRDMAARRLSPD